MTDTDLESLAAEFILELKDRAYPGLGRRASNELEGDFGTWGDWKSALVEFAKRAAPNTREGL